MAIKEFRVIALGEFIPYHWLTDPINEELSKESMNTGDSEEESTNIFT